MPDPPTTPTSRRFTPGARNVCPVGENRARSPSRHRKDATVYGHTTTAVHGMSTPRPPPRMLEYVPTFSTSRHIPFPILYPTAGANGGVIAINS